MIRSVARQVGRTLAPAIEDEQLMSDQHGLGDNGTESTGPRQSSQGDDQMNEYDSEVAHPGNGINISQTPALRPIWQFAIDRLQQSLLPVGPRDSHLLRWTSLLAARLATILRIDLFN